jgi:hypothetical protein
MIAVVGEEEDGGEKKGPEEVVPNDKSSIASTSWCTRHMAYRSVSLCPLYPEGQQISHGRVHRPPTTMWFLMPSECSHRRSELLGTSTRRFSPPAILSKYAVSAPISSGAESSRVTLSPAHQLWVTLTQTQTNTTLHLSGVPERHVSSKLGRMIPAPLPCTGRMFATR